MKNVHKCVVCGNCSNYKSRYLKDIFYCSKDCEFKNEINNKKSSLSNDKTYEIIKEKNNSKKKNKRKSRNKKKEINEEKEEDTLIKKNEKNKKIKLRNISETKTKDTGTNNSATTLKGTQIEDKNLFFDFNHNLWNIIFLKKGINEKGETFDIYEGDINKKSLRTIIINNKIKMIYDLLITHMKYLKEKVLLVKGKSYFFEKIEFYFKKYNEIEKYIFNCIFLIRLFYDLGDPISLIKANQTMNYLAKELLDYNYNGGLLIYSINTILKKCMGLLKIKKYYRSIHIPFKIIKKYLLLLSTLIKFSSLLNIPKIYHKFLNHYAQIYEFALSLLTNQHSSEKIILRSSLIFNTGCFFMKKNLIKSAMKLYKKVINLQEESEHKSFVYYASYYNCSILYYVMEDIKNSEQYLGNILNEIERVPLKSKKALQNIRNFLCKLLIFNAEFNLEKHNYLKAIEILKNVLKIIENIYKKEKQIITKIGNYPSYTKTINGSINKMRERNKRFSTTTRKKMEKNPCEFLFEVEFYQNPLEIKLFNEKIKEIVNGLFNTILYLQKEKKTNSTNNNNYFDNSNIKLKRSNSFQYLEKQRNKGFKKRNKSVNLNHKTINNIFEVEKNEEKREDFEDINNIGKEEEKTFINEKRKNEILNYFKDVFVKKIKIINNNEDINTFKYFVALLANLSLRQIEILNNTQNKDVPRESFYNLPIFFSSQFKNSLNQTQRDIFNKINYLFLIRAKILGNPNKNICLSNINYKLFQSIRITFNLRLKSYDEITNKIKKVMNVKSNKNYIYNNYIQNISDESNSNSNELINKYEAKNKRLEFKYENEMNLDRFKNELINEMNLSYLLYSKDEINSMKLIIESNIFTSILNQMEYKDIKIFIKDKTLLLEILNNEIKKIKEENKN